MDCYTLNILIFGGERNEGTSDLLPASTGVAGLCRLVPQATVAASSLCPCGAGLTSGFRPRLTVETSPFLFAYGTSLGAGDALGEIGEGSLFRPANYSHSRWCAKMIWRHLMVPLFPSSLYTTDQDRDIGLSDDVSGSRLSVYFQQLHALRRKRWKKRASPCC